MSDYSPEKKPRTRQPEEKPKWWMIGDFATESMCWGCGIDHMAWRRTAVRIVCDICETPLPDDQALFPVSSVRADQPVPSMKPHGLLQWVMPIPYSTIRGTARDGMHQEDV